MKKKITAIFLCVALVAIARVLHRHGQCHEHIYCRRRKNQTDRGAEQ